MTCYRQALRQVLVTTAVALFAAVWALPAAAQARYPTPDAAASAFEDALARNDDDALKVVLGADWRSYIPRNPAHQHDVTDFLEAWSKGHKIIPVGKDRASLEVGTHGWTLPIPLAKSPTGWYFDAKAAPDEIRTRRIGRNELAVINVALAYTDAQEDYAQHDRDQDGIKQYAQKFLSSPGKRDGLYWPTLPGEDASPLGPLAADVTPGEAYHGYFYRILTAQGEHAPGGAKSYIVNGNMTGGFGLVAWPAKWGETGVMTFIVDKDQMVYQKDLGPQTAEIAKAMKAYDPDSTWQKVNLP